MSAVNLLLCALLFPYCLGITVEITRDAKPETCSYQGIIRLAHPMSIDRHDSFYELGIQMLGAAHITIDKINRWPRCGVSLRKSGSNFQNEIMANYALALAAYGGESSEDKTYEIGGEIGGMADFLLAGYSSCLSGILTPLAQNARKLCCPAAASATAAHANKSRVFGMLPPNGLFLESAFRGLEQHGARTVAYIAEEGEPTCGGAPDMADKYNTTFLNGTRIPEKASIEIYEQAALHLKELNSDVIFTCVRTTYDTWNQALRRVNFVPKAQVYTMIFGTPEFEKSMGDDLPFIMGVSAWDRALSPIPDGATGWTPRELDLEFELAAARRPAYQHTAQSAAISILIQALERLNRSDFDSPVLTDLIARIIQSSSFPTVYGNVSFDENGPSAAPYLLLQYDANKTLHVLVPEDQKSTDFELHYPLPSWKARDRQTKWRCQKTRGICTSSGECDCLAPLVAIGGTGVTAECMEPAVESNTSNTSTVALAVAMPVVVVALLVGTAVFVYYQQIKGKNDSVWQIKKEDLVFTHPPEVVRRGTFGEVLLAEYRGTQVAVKRVLPPQKGRASKKAEGDSVDEPESTHPKTGIGRASNNSSNFNGKASGKASGIGMASADGIRRTSQKDMTTSKGIRLMKQDFIHEMRYLSKLRHPCIVTVIGTVTAANIRNHPLIEPSSSYYQIDLCYYCIHPPYCFFQPTNLSPHEATMMNKRSRVQKRLHWIDDFSATAFVTPSNHDRCSSKTHSSSWALFSLAAIAALATTTFSNGYSQSTVGLFVPAAPVVEGLAFTSFCQVSILRSSRRRQLPVHVLFLGTQNPHRRRPSNHHHNIGHSTVGHDAESASRKLLQSQQQQQQQQQQQHSGTAKQNSQQKQKKHQHPPPPISNTEETKKRRRRRNTFAVMFVQLKTYYEEHGHCIISPQDPDHQDLYKWTKSIRKNYKHQFTNEIRPVSWRNSTSIIRRPMLKESRVKLLQSVDFCWDIPTQQWNQRWNEQYDRLVTFCETHDIHDYHDYLDMLPVLQQADPSLAIWVQNQRREYRWWLQDLPSSLTVERLEALEELGIILQDYQSQQEVWLQQYHYLVEFYQTHGHAHVPYNYRHPVTITVVTENGIVQERNTTFALGQWCVNQRRAKRQWKALYRHLMRAKKKKKKKPKNTVSDNNTDGDSSNLNDTDDDNSNNYKNSREMMTAERINLLEALEFPWNTRETKWQRMLHRLNAYYKKHGNLKFTTADHANQDLRLWLIRQRHYYRRREQLLALEESSSSSSSSTAKSTTTVPSYFYESSPMTPKRIQSLESIPNFTWNAFNATNKGPSAEDWSKLFSALRSKGISSAAKAKQHMFDGTSPFAVEVKSQWTEQELFDLFHQDDEDDDGDGNYNVDGYRENDDHYNYHFHVNPDSYSNKTGVRV